jgi:integrase
VTGPASTRYEATLFGPGAIAQLGERLDRTQEVAGSSPASSTAQNRCKSATPSAIGLHEARHTFASMLIAAGVNAKAISSYLNHASVTLTYDRYGHLMPGNEAEAAASLDRYLADTDTSRRRTVR